MKFFYLDTENEFHEEVSDGYCTYTCKGWPFSHCKVEKSASVLNLWFSEKLFVFFRLGTLQVMGTSNQLVAIHTHQKTEENFSATIHSNSISYR